MSFFDLKLEYLGNRLVFRSYFRVWIRGLGEMFDEITRVNKTRETVPLNDPNWSLIHTVKWLFRDVRIWSSFLKFVLLFTSCDKLYLSYCCNGATENYETTRVPSTFLWSKLIPGVFEPGLRRHFKLLQWHDLELFYNWIFSRWKNGGKWPQSALALLFSLSFRLFSSYFTIKYKERFLF
jgi:hypothetical protein